MFLGPVRLSPSLSFREVLQGIRASLVRFLFCPLHPCFFSFLFFFFFFFCPASCIPMGPGRSSTLRIGGDSSAESGSGRTGGESNRLAMVVLRDAPGEPPSPLGQGKDKIDEIKYPMGSEYLKSAVQNAWRWVLTGLSLYLGKSSQDDIGPRLVFRSGLLTY